MSDALQACIINVPSTGDIRILYGLASTLGINGLKNSDVLENEFIVLTGECIEGTILPMPQHLDQQMTTFIENCKVPTNQDLSDIGALLLINNVITTSDLFPPEIRVKDEIGKYLGLMRPRGLALLHPAAPLLLHYCTYGCPVDCSPNSRLLSYEDHTSQPNTLTWHNAYSRKHKPKWPAILHKSSNIKPSMTRYHLHSKSHQ